MLQLICSISLKKSLVLQNPELVYQIQSQFGPLDKESNMAHTYDFVFLAISDWSAEQTFYPTAGVIRAFTLLNNKRCYLIGLGKKLSKEK